VFWMFEGRHWMEREGKGVCIIWEVGCSRLCMIALFCLPGHCRNIRNCEGIKVDRLLVTTAFVLFTFWTADEAVASHC
jgi:hypothetical protein